MDFLKGDTCRRLDGFFCVKGTVGMLQASEYNNVDMFAIFRAVVVNSCCSLESSALVTKTFVRYVDFKNFIYMRQICPGCSKDDLGQLSRIRQFKTIVRGGFSKFQASTMGTL